MAMIARTEENMQGLLRAPGGKQADTVWQKLQKGTALQGGSEDTVIGKASEVFISKEGRKLYADSQEPLQKLTQTDFMTEGEKKLQELLDKKTEREEFKHEANELEKRLQKESDTLTDDEKQTMQQKIEELREAAKSPTEKLHEEYQKKFALEGEKAEGLEKHLSEDLLILQKQILQAEKDIRKAENEIEAEGMWQEAYEMQALLERADLSIARSRADYLGKEIDFRSSEQSLLVRTDEQVQEAAEENSKRQPTAADVVQAAVEEGKARAEKAEDDTGRLADGGRDAALSYMEKVANGAVTGEADGTQDILKRAEAWQKITLEEAKEG